MAAAQAALTEVLTPEAYARLEEHNAQLMAALDELLARYGLPGTPWAWAPRAAWSSPPSD